jgi:hypothetical protein
MSVLLIATIFSESFWASGSARDMRQAPARYILDSMTRALLLVAHPGHELLLQGWMSHTKPLVNVMTDGSGHQAAPRIGRTLELLREIGVQPGSLFGRLTDREAYGMILTRDAARLLALAAELAAVIETCHPEMLVTDASEGYNPVHDLCRLIGGAAIEMSGKAMKHYEYSVVRHPWQEPMTGHGDVTFFDLDDHAYAAKMERAWRYGSQLHDVDEQLLRHGAEAFRREALRVVTDWRVFGGAEQPLYERLGEERVAAHRYERVIREKDILSLRDAVCNALDERPCVF